MKEKKLELIVDVLKKLTDEERLEVLGSFCRSCGWEQPKESICQCWNDE